MPSGTGPPSALLPSVLPCSLPGSSPTLRAWGLRDAGQGGGTERSPQSCEPATQQLATTGQGVWESLLPLLGAGDTGWKAPDTQGVWPMQEEPSRTRVTCQELASLCSLSSVWPKLSVAQGSGFPGTGEAPLP